VRAYECYLRGRYYWNKRTEDSLKRSVDFFEEALRIEPKNPLAQAGLAESCVTLGLYGAVAPNVIMPKAQVAAKAALDLRPDLPEALTAQACIEAVYEWDWANAERHFKRVIEANPNYAGAHQWYAINCLVPIGRFDEAHASVQRSRALE